MNIRCEQFRKQVIRSVLFAPTDLPTALEKLCFLQADPIRCPARAQDLILRHRVKHYVAGDLEKKYPELSLEEFYLFAYGFGSRALWSQLLPVTDAPLDADEENALKLVVEHGEMHPKKLEDLLGSGRKKNYWGGFSRASKLLLDTMHERGDLRVVRRERGVRVYGPSDIKLNERSEADRFKEIILASLHAMGPVSRRFLMSELRHFTYIIGDRNRRLRCIDDLIRMGALRVDQVEGEAYLSLADLKLNRIQWEQVRILAPFDPIVRDRNRFLHLWGWEYRFEAYTPKAKRKLGYYAMPVLWRDRAIGWANTEVTGSKLSLEINYLGRRPRDSKYREAAEAEANRLLKFLGLKDGELELRY
ncbi:MAG: DNA glycosylase AlkZ-like family protein [Opitutales bacterium]